MLQFIICFSDFRVSSVVNAGDCVPTEVFIFSTANDACKYCVVEMFVFMSALSLSLCLIRSCVRLIQTLAGKNKWKNNGINTRVVPEISYKTA